MFQTLKPCCVLCSRLARFYADSQEVLFDDPEFQQLGRVWRELSSLSNLMDTLRNNPSQVSGEGLLYSDPVYPLVFSVTGKLYGCHSNEMSNIPFPRSFLFTCFPLVSLFDMCLL